MSHELIILFDGVCNLCNASINFVIDRDVDRLFLFGTLQSREGRKLLEKNPLEMPELASIILVEKHEGIDPVFYRESDAILKIASRLPGIWKMTGILRLVPPFIRDGIYRWIARNRYRWFGRQDVCRLPTPDLEARFIEPINTPEIQADF